MSTFYIDYVNGSDAGAGTSWGTAWKTITNGATAARIAPGDVIRIAKSSAPVSIGNATWTNMSKTVTLATAQTQLINDCETNWTGANSATCTLQNTYYKYGSNGGSVSFPSTRATNTKFAYFATGSLDLSSYQRISFFILASAAVSATQYKVCLCSDTTGDTIVDSFDIPPIASLGAGQIVISKTGGGNLGASIQSIAIYTGSTSSSGTMVLYFDNFNACTTTGLNNTSLISKNSAEFDGDEAWYAIASISGTTIYLDEAPKDIPTAFRGYSGTTETVATYMRSTINYLGSHTIQDSGTAGNLIEFSGGWNTSSGLQDGETLFDGSGATNSATYNGFYGSTVGYIKASRLGFYRYNIGITIAGTPGSLYLDNIRAGNSYGNGVNPPASFNTINSISQSTCNGGAGISMISSANNVGILKNLDGNKGNGATIGGAGTIIENIKSASNNAGNGAALYGGNLCVIKKIERCNDNASYGISGTSMVNWLSTSGNTSSGINGDSILYLKNALIAESTEVNISTNQYGGYVYSMKHDQTANNHWVFAFGGTINSATNDRAGGTGLKWKLALSSSTRNSTLPLQLPLMKVAVNANSLVTVTAYCMKDHATNIAAKLFILGTQLAGVPSDLVATKADDTNWEQLTLTFTPTESGVIEILGQAYYVAGNSNAYFADVTVTQA